MGQPAPVDQSLREEAGSPAALNVCTSRAKHGRRGHRTTACCVFIPVSSPLGTPHRLEIFFSQKVRASRPASRLRAAQQPTTRPAAEKERLTNTNTKEEGSSACVHPRAFITNNAPKKRAPNLFTRGRLEVFERSRVRRPHGLAHPQLHPHHDDRVPESLHIHH